MRSEFGLNLVSFWIEVIDCLTSLVGQYFCYEEMKSVISWKLPVADV